MNKKGCSGRRSASVTFLEVISKRAFCLKASLIRDPHVRWRLTTSGLLRTTRSVRFSHLISWRRLGDSEGGDSALFCFIWYFMTSCSQQEPQTCSFPADLSPGFECFCSFYMLIPPHTDVMALCGRHKRLMGVEQKPHLHFSENSFSSRLPIMQTHNLINPTLVESKYTLKVLNRVDVFPPRLPRIRRRWNRFDGLRHTGSSRLVNPFLISAGGMFHHKNAEV